jgi:hypothetical protein
MKEEYMTYLTSSLYGTSGYVSDKFINDGRIKFPSTFKDVVLKLCPEVSDVVTVGYMERPATYDPMSFEQVKRFLVSVDIHFDSRNGIKKTKVEYEEFINDYFKMTYADIDFITISVNSFIFPPEKTNTDKFFELFGK